MVINTITMWYPVFIEMAQNMLTLMYFGFPQNENTNFLNNGIYRSLRVLRPGLHTCVFRKHSWEAVSIPVWGTRSTWASAHGMQPPPTAFVAAFSHRLFLRTIQAGVVPGITRSDPVTAEHSSWCPDGCPLAAYGTSSPPPPSAISLLSSHVRHSLSLDTHGPDGAKEAEGNPSWCLSQPQGRACLGVGWGFSKEGEQVLKEPEKQAAECLWCVWTEWPSNA